MAATFYANPQPQTPIALTLTSKSLEIDFFNHCAKSHQFKIS